MVKWDRNYRETAGRWVEDQLLDGRVLQIRRRGRRWVAGEL